jgi:hypothetical protein
MSILFVSLMGAPLFLAPVWTHLRFKEAFLLEKTFIAMDNASIRLGQSFRDALEILQRGRLEILALEAFHHVSHACAASPVPLNAVCRAEDARIEFQIETRRTAILAKAQAAWSQGDVLAGLESQRLETSLHWDRARELPVRSRFCSVCQRPAEWVPLLPWKTQVQARVFARSLANRIEAENAQGMPTYRVLSEKENE